MLKSINSTQINSINDLISVFNTTCYEDMVLTGMDLNESYNNTRSIIITPLNNASKTIMEIYQYDMINYTWDKQIIDINRSCEMMKLGPVNITKAVYKPYDNMTSYDSLNDKGFGGNENENLSSSTIPKPVLPMSSSKYKK